MKAMILAAGLGTRLRPLTNNKPKALVEINGIPLLEFAIRRLKFFGVREIIINIHHFGDHIIRFLNEKNHFNIKISISDERDQLLETGGGLKKAAWFFRDGKPFILCNADVISDINLNEMYQAHMNSNALATLAVRKRKSSRYLIFNKENILCGWKNENTQDIRMSRPDAVEQKNLAFSGIHLIDPKLFKYFKSKQGAFSIIETYLEASKEEPVIGFSHDEGIWLDVGKKESLELASKIIEQIPISN